MALVVKDRVKQTTTTTGTGNIVLNGNVDGFQTFAAALTDGDTTYFGIFVPSTNDYEVGLGTWTEGSATLARTTILESSNSGSAINITAQAEVFITQPAEKAVFQDANGDVDLGGNKILFGNLYSTTGDLPSASTYHGMFAHVHGTGKAYYAHGGNWIELVNEDTSGNVSMGGNLTVTGDLTVNGTTTTVNTTNTVVTDTLIELGNGTSGSPSNDAGIVIERGSSDNAFIGYDESADKFTVGTGSFTGATTGNLTISTGTLVANVEGNVTGNVTGNVSGSSGSTTGNAATATTAGTVTTAAQTNITSLGTLTGLDINGDLNAVDNIVLATAMYHEGDTNTFLSFGSNGDSINLATGGSTRLTASNSGVTINDITINGSTISDGGDLTFDVGGDIILDADGGDVKLKDGGTEFAHIGKSSNNLFLYSAISDGDIQLIGVDGGAQITALSLDMSDAGAATFNAGANFGGNVDINGNLNAVDGIYMSNALFHEGDTDTHLSFGTDLLALTTGGTARVYVSSSGVQLGDTGNGYFQPVSGDYGSIQIDGGAHTSWEGYSIGGRAVFMHNNSTGTSIYDDVNNKYLWYATHGGASYIYHNGAYKINTTSTGINIDGDLNAVDNIYVADKIYHEGDTDTYLEFHAANQFRVVTGGAEMFEVNDSTVQLSAELHLGGNIINSVEDIYLRDKIYHEGDTDTYIGFTTNAINLNAGGGEVLSAASNGLFSQYALSEDYDALSGTSPTCNVQLGGAFSLTMSGNTTFTFSGAVSGYGVGFILQLTGNGSTVTWPGSVKWAGGTAPDAPANGETDILVFHTRDGGSNWYGVLASDAAA